MSNKIGVAVVGAMLTANVAWAGSVLEDTVSACTVINCGAMSIRGVHQANEPFVVQVFAAEGECLRLDVDSQTQDMAMLISSPSVNLAGVNDDRDFDGGDFRPLIFIDPVPATGWYTIAVSYFDLGPLVGKFILKYGRYPGGNLNCPIVATSSSPSLERLGGNPSKSLSTRDGATGNSGRNN
jgi:hypothetical protein